MAKRSVLVKNLATIETLGCMSVLCTDKTGTLTEGKMVRFPPFPGYLFTNNRQFKILRLSMASITSPICGTHFKILVLGI